MAQLCLHNSSVANEASIMLHSQAYWCRSRQSCYIHATASHALASWRPSGLTPNQHHQAMKPGAVASFDTIFDLCVAKSSLACATACMNMPPCCCMPAHTCCERVLARVLAVIDKQLRSFRLWPVITSVDDGGTLRHEANSMCSSSKGRGSKPVCLAATAVP